MTPIINFSVDLFNAMAKISSLVETEWYFGLPFGDALNDANALSVARHAQSILGDHLLGLQLGNEPDLYASHQRRPANYSIADYFNDFHKVSFLFITPCTRIAVPN